MGLNDLQLNSKLLSALYSSALVSLHKQGIGIPGPKTSPPIDRPIIPVADEPQWKYLGTNKKNILIIVDYDSAVHLPDEELSFLTNMLTACKLNLGDVVIVNKHTYKERIYKEYLDNFKSTTALLFGVDPLLFGLPVGFPQFQVQSVAGCTFLYSTSLEQTRNDALLKSKLWVSLRNIFGL